MIEDFVPQLTSEPTMHDLLTTGPSLEQTLLDPAGRQLSNLEVAAPLSDPVVSSLADPAPPARLEVSIPAYLMEEIRRVAQVEHCDLSELVVSALDQFLADHWIRNRDDH